MRQLETGFAKPDRRMSRIFPGHVGIYQVGDDQLSQNHKTRLAS